MTSMWCMLILLLSSDSIQDRLIDRIRKPADRLALACTFSYNEEAIKISDKLKTNKSAANGECRMFFDHGKIYIDYKSTNTKSISVFDGNIFYEYQPEYYTKGEKYKWGKTSMSSSEADFRSGPIDAMLWYYRPFDHAIKMLNPEWRVEAIDSNISTKTIRISAPEIQLSHELVYSVKDDALLSCTISLRGEIVKVYKYETGGEGIVKFIGTAYIKDQPIHREVGQMHELPLTEIDPKYFSVPFTDGTYVNDYTSKDHTGYVYFSDGNHHRVHSPNKPRSQYVDEAYEARAKSSSSKVLWLCSAIGFAVVFAISVFYLRTCWNKTHLTRGVSHER